MFHTLMFKSIPCIACAISRVGTNADVVWKSYDLKGGYFLHQHKI